MSSELPNSNESPRSNQNGPNTVIHKFMIGGTTIMLFALLQVKSQGNESLFETERVTVMAFLVTIAFYCLACYAKEVVNFRRPEIIEYYARLLGFLSNDLLLLMVVPILGWIGLVIWLCCFFAVTFWSCKNITIQDFHQAKNEVFEKWKNLMGNRSNLSTGSSEETGMTDGSDSMV